ncbi:CBS domain-containing protein [Zestomonas thermotolerans]|jgi:CBS domain-containing protein|uniref:CBS domain-containing protein n=1 Tax=Zestomonas thermotolerans TaxID=157784 RepID=UPI0004828E11|nr:CBS domain-containing protein [Pseudomonas thermotolerans]MBO2509436.1 CBS domain-containing protein [Gammaproteobacteria bacterium]
MKTVGDLLRGKPDSHLYCVGPDTSVAEIMTRELFVVGLSDSNQYCMQLMIEKNLRHLPVLEQGELVGLLSIRDLVRDVTSEQENLIEQLQQYIRGA